jgi:hypothetical protein
MVASWTAPPSRGPAPVEHAAMLEEKHVSLAAIAPVKTALAEHENREVLAALLAAHLSGRRLRERRTMAGLASFVPVGLDLRTAAEAMAATSADSCRSMDALARDATAAILLAELFDGEINVFRMTQRASNVERDLAGRRAMVHDAF